MKKRQLVLKKEMDQWMLVTDDLGSAAKGLAIGLEAAGSGPAQLPFCIPFSLPCVAL